MREDTILPKGWVTTKVGDICREIQYGYTASASDEPCGPRFLRITDIQNGQVVWPSVPHCSINSGDTEKFSLRPGDIVFARTGGTVGKSFLINHVPEPSVFASYLIRLTANEGIDPQYLYHFFQSLSYWEQIGLKKGGLQGNVNATTLSSIELPIGPTKEQRRIVAKVEELFSELDKGVESLTTAREQLKVYREAVLQRCFLSGATREHPLSETPLPRSWRWEKLSALATLITKGASPKWQGINYVEDESQTLFVTSENVRSNFMDLDKPKFVQNVFNEGQKRSILKVGDVLFNIVGASIGRAAIFDDERSANINQAVALIRIEKRSIAEYVAYFLNSALGQSAYMDKRVEVARANLSLKDVGDIEVPLPPPSEFQSVVDFIEASLSRIDTLDQELDDEERRAGTLRQAILKKSFSGQLVAQDPTDEPASVLLELIRADPEEGGTTKRRNNKNGKKEAA